MAGSGEDVIWIIMPPEFEYFPGLFLPDLARARLAARLALLADRLRSRGHGVYFDPGRQGLMADETARMLGDHGARRIVLAGARNDRFGIAILSEALKSAGIDPGRPCISEGDGGDILTPLASRIESLAKMDLYLQGRPCSGAAAESCLMILEEGEAQPGLGVPFRKAGDRLIRLAAGRAGSIPPGFTEIRFLSLGEAVLKQREGDHVLLALGIPGSAPDHLNLDDWEPVLGRGASAQCRLFMEDPGSGNTPACGGAAWAFRHGLDRPAIRELLQQIVTQYFPAQLPLFRALCGVYEVGADPLEEMYAGNSLKDRNAELIELIVP
jgi:hypothetical protein